MSTRMVNMTFFVPDELKKRMDGISGVDWSQVARQALEEALKKREMLRATEATDRLRESTKLSGGSGVRKIRKWRDADRKQ